MRVGRREVTFVYDYGQVYLYDADRSWSKDSAEFLQALDDARSRGLSVGVADDLVDILMPRQDNFEAELVVEECDESPPIVEDEWDHIVEFPLVLPTGTLLLAASGGSGETRIELPAGTFRARWSGRNFAEAAAWGYSEDVQDHPADEYRLQIWPDTGQHPPEDIKTWPTCRARAS
jgi:hypothetical protein